MKGIFKYQYNDIDKLNEMARKVGYQASYLQLKPGILQVDVSRFSLINVEFMRKKIKGSVEIQGSGRKTHFTFLLVFFKEGFRLNGIEHDPDEFYIISPGAQVHIVTHGFAEIISFAVPTSIISNLFLPDSMSSSIETISTTSLLKIDQTSINRLKAIIKACTQEHLALELKYDLEILLVECFAQIQAKKQPLKRCDILGVKEKRRCLIYVQDYIASNFDKSITISDLVQIGGINERKLQRVFYSELGCSPSEYIRTYRLETVRKKLISEKFKQESITTLVLDSGFKHLSRFSRDFRKHFGLLPSEVRKLAHKA